MEVGFIRPDDPLDFFFYTARLSQKLCQLLSINGSYECFPRSILFTSTAFNVPIFSVICAVVQVYCSSTWGLFIVVILRYIILNLVLLSLSCFCFDCMTLFCFWTHTKTPTNIQRCEEEHYKMCTNIFCKVYNEAFPIAIFFFTV